MKPTVMTYTEQFLCPNPACENRQIDAGHVVITKTDRDWMRHVHVRCTACGKVHADLQVKTGDFWRGSPTPTLVTDARKIASIQSSIDQQTGVVQSLAS